MECSSQAAHAWCWREAELWILRCRLFQIMCTQKAQGVGTCPPIGETWVPGWFWISHLNNRVLSSSMRYCRGCGFARIAHQSSLRAQPKSRYSSSAPRRRTGPRIGSTICRLWDLCIRPFCDQVKLPKCSNFVVFFCFRTHSHAKQRPPRVVLTCGLQSYCRTEKLSPIRTLACWRWGGGFASARRAVDDPLGRGFS